MIERILANLISQCFTLYPSPVHGHVLRLPANAGDDPTPKFVRQRIALPQSTKRQYLLSFIRSAILLGNKNQGLGLGLFNH